MNQFATRPKLQRGASMIEVLVSLTIVAFGLLGLAGLAGALDVVPEGFVRSQGGAEVGAQMVERVRANYDGFTGGEYDRTMLPTDAGLHGCESRVRECTGLHGGQGRQPRLGMWADRRFGVGCRLPART